MHMCNPKPTGTQPMNKIAIKIITLLALAAFLAAGTACSDHAKADSKRGKKAMNRAKQETRIKKERTSGRSPAKKNSDPLSPDDFLVVQVDVDEPQVLKRSELDTLREELKADYRSELNRYREEKKEAEKSGGIFDQPKPTRPRLRISRPVFKTEAEARSYRDKLAMKKSKTRKAGKKAGENP